MFMKNFIEYFGSEWSFASCQILDKKTILAFSEEPHTLIVVSYTGNYYIIKFTPDG